METKKRKKFPNYLHMSEKSRIFAATFEKHARL